ncbi:MAG: hypothetical protein KGD59_00200 [Candidatus Heimdallarchaeota archaeon]|nr:hypothetical protein [Candidatus Heimdallarchaeota archaeon]MBY8992940.1 hypothetical protein [Candidatus Heimdallarchaeota archaeon]
MKKIVLHSIFIIALFAISVGLMKKTQPIAKSLNHDINEENRISKKLNLGPIGSKGIMIVDLDNYSTKRLYSCKEKEIISLEEGFLEKNYSFWYFNLPLFDK